MSIGKATICLVALLSAARQLAAQGATLGENSTPLTVSGFAIGSGSWDRNLKQNRLMGSKIALSLFRPWSDQLYLFAQLTTHVEVRSEEHTSELQSQSNLVCRLLLEKKKKKTLS